MGKGESFPISFEFFPPATPAGAEKLMLVHAELARIKPAFFSVTFGAGGSTRDRTLDAILSIKQAGSEAAPHLSCIGATRAGLHTMLERYRELGVRRIVALRGDLPSGVGDPGELRHASELVAFIRESFGRQFLIEVAAYPEYHPEARSPDQDLDYFRLKVEAGADAAITQYFFNADAYEHFLEQTRARGIGIPIVPGVMPIANFAKIARFSDACGAEIPRWIRLKMESFGDDQESVRAFGLDVLSGLCERLLRLGAPGLHFYTLNQAGLSREICRRLGLGDHG